MQEHCCITATSSPEAVLGGIHWWVQYVIVGLCRKKFCKTVSAFTQVQECIAIHFYNWLQCFILLPSHGKTLCAWALRPHSHLSVFMVPSTIILNILNIMYSVVAVHIQVLRCLQLKPDTPKPTATFEPDLGVFFFWSHKLQWEHL